MSTAKPERIKLTTPEHRASYVSLVKPRSQKGDDGQLTEPKYSMLIALKKDHPETKPFLIKLMAAIQLVSQQSHGVVGGIPKDKLKHYPIKDGKTMEGEQFDDFYVIRASSKVKPQTIDKAGNILCQHRTAVRLESKGRREVRRRWRCQGRLQCLPGCRRSRGRLRPPGWSLIC